MHNFSAIVKNLSIVSVYLCIFYPILSFLDALFVYGTNVACVSPMYDDSISVGKKVSFLGMFPLTIFVARLESMR